jgi:hypothetical protein
MQRMIGAGSGPYPSPQERASPAFSRKLTAAAKAGEQDAIDKENRITDTRAAARNAVDSLLDGAHGDIDGDGALA